VIAAARAQLLRAATNAAVAVALLLAAAKIAVFFFSGSVALLASALDSALDGSASLLNALAVRYALRPPDSDHRFGHGKSEALAGVAQALFITGSGVFVIVRAVVRLVHPEPLSAALPAVLVMVASALLLARAGLERADPLLGLLIALVTLYGAWRIGADAFSVLMDHELPANLRLQIERIVLAHAQVRGMHALRTRMSGSTPLIQFHIELDPASSLVDANRIAHDVEAAVNDAFPEADVTIHQDPFGQPCHRQRE
jgi:ferrous-iron efflux pump FieF